MNIDGLPLILAAHRRRRPVWPPNLIVLHSGETGEGSTAAEGMANYFASGATIGSAHICADNDSVVRCAHDDERTNGAGGVNDEALHLEQSGRAGQLAHEWADPYSSSVVAHAAQVCAAWIRKFPNIRRVWLDEHALRRGDRNGITDHAAVTRAGFAGNDGHWDPGPNYPRGALMEHVRAELEGVAAGGTPTPQQEDDDMGLIVVDLAGAWWWCRGEVRTLLLEGKSGVTLIFSGLAKAFVTEGTHGKATVIDTLAQYKEQGRSLRAAA